VGLMASKKPLPDKLAVLVERARQLGTFAAVFYTVRPYLAKAGLTLTPFYYAMETLGPGGGAEAAPLPDGFAFSVFGPEDIAVIAAHPERASYVSADYVLDNHRSGDTCIGLKRQGVIAAFCWFSLEANRAKGSPVRMGAHEAYLYDLYVFEAFRGRHLALALRHKTYEMLRGLERTVFYTVTEYANTASMRFKQRLGARVLFLGLAVRVFGRYHWTLVLKRSPGTEARGRSKDPDAGTARSRSSED